MRMRSIVFVLAALLAGLNGASAAESYSVQVYKSPTCGCCSKWITHMQEHGFKVTSTDVQTVDTIKAQHHVPKDVSSCHTAIVEGYVVEGHVPAVDVLRLLREKPKVIGIAVPGMPRGSPGMEAPNPETYDVVTFDKAGKTTVFATHKP
jgi:hypothetical protein